MVHADHAASVEHDGVFDLGIAQFAAGADRGVRPDVRIGQHRAGTDRSRSAHDGSLQTSAGFDHNPAFDARELVDRTVDSARERVEDQPVAVEQRILLPGVDPPSVEDLVRDGVTVVEQPLDRVGDLELTACRRHDRAHGFVNSDIEDVHAREREVGRRVARLLDEVAHVAVAVELGDAELGRVVDVSEQDLRGRDARRVVLQRRLFVPALLEAVDDLFQPQLQHVVAEVHDEVVVAEELTSDQDAVCEAQRFGLWDVRDLEPERRAVAEYGFDFGGRVADDHAHFFDARIGHLLDDVEQDRLVRNRNELLRTRMRDRTQASAGAAGQDEAFHHGPLTVALPPLPGAVVALPEPPVGTFNNGVRFLSNGKMMVLAFGELTSCFNAWM